MLSFDSPKVLRMKTFHEEREREREKAFSKELCTVESLQVLRKAQTTFKDLREFLVRLKIFVHLLEIHCVGLSLQKSTSIDLHHQKAGTNHFASQLHTKLSFLNCGELAEALSLFLLLKSAFNTPSVYPPKTFSIQIAV